MTWKPSKENPTTSAASSLTMWFLYVLSWVSTIVQILFVTLAIGEPV